MNNRTCMADTRSALLHTFKWLAFGLGGLGLLVLLFTHGSSLAPLAEPLGNILATVGKYLGVAVMVILTIIAFPFWLLTYVSVPLSVLSVMPDWTLGNSTFMPQLHSFFVVLTAIPFIASRFSDKRWVHDAGNTMLALALVGIPVFAWGIESLMYAIHGVTGFDVKHALGSDAVYESQKTAAGHLMLGMVVLMFSAVSMAIPSLLNPQEEWYMMDKTEKLEPVWVFPARLAGFIGIATALIGGLCFGIWLTQSLHWFAVLAGGALGSFIAGGSAIMAYSATIGCKRY